MAFIVEDGSGLSTATSYTARAEADAYHADRGNPTAWSTGTDEHKEEALVRATQWLDAEFGSRWPGRRGSKEQGLDFPRIEATTADGYAIDTDEIPGKHKNAVAELALQLAPIGSDDPLGSENKSTIKMEDVTAGAVRRLIQYGGAGKSAKKKYPAINGLLRSLLSVSGTRARG